MASIDLGPARATDLTRRWRAALPRANAGFLVLGGVTLVALVGPLLAPHDPADLVGTSFARPGEDGFLLGSDALGRDLLSRTLHGLRTSWLAALAVVAIGLLVGGLVGLVAGARGGWVDSVLMRVTDAFLALPAPVLAIAIVAALGPGLRNSLLAVSLVWWPFYARVVRGEVRALAGRPHVEAARMAGAGPVRIALVHLLPGVIPTAVITATMDLGTLVLTLAGLSFLGLGQPAPAAELGADSARNMPFLLQYWWVPVIPGLAVMLLALVGTLAGGSLATSLDRSRRD